MPSKQRPAHAVDANGKQALCQDQTSVPLRTQIILELNKVCPGSWNLIHTALTPLCPSRAGLKELHDWVSAPDPGVHLPVLAKAGRGRGGFSEPLLRGPAHC